MIFLFATLFLLLLVGLFSGIEVGLISLLPARVQHGVRNGHRGAGILAYFMRHPDHLLATTLVTQNVCLVVASNSALYGLAQLGLETPAAFLALTVVITSLLLTLEIVGKDWFRQHPYDRCRRFAYPLYAAFWLFWLPVTLSAKFTGLVNRLVGGRLADDDTARGLMREDFRILLRESETDGLIDPAAADLLDRSLDFHHLRVSDVFRHRGEVLQIAATATLAEALAQCRTGAIAHAPVFVCDTPPKGDQPWRGIFNVYDVLFTIPEPEWTTTRVADILRPVMTVAADQRMEDVLVEVKRSRSSLLVVTPPDDPERHLGIVTPTDVARVLFG